MACNRCRKPRPHVAAADNARAPAFQFYAVLFRQYEQTTEHVFGHRVCVTAFCIKQSDVPGIQVVKVHVIDAA